jgi:hypothetical protein
MTLALGSVLLVACDGSVSAPASTTAESTQVPTASVGAVEGTPIRAQGDYYCTSSVTGTFQNVIVPEQATCTLTNAIVSANILAKAGASVFVLSTTTGGNIDGVEAAVVHVRAGRVGGSIHAVDGQSPGASGVRIYGGTVLTQGNITIQKMNTGTIAVTDARLLKGNIQIQENQISGRLDVLRNVVAQNLEVFVNSGAGSKTVANNRVSQKLSCKDNTAPFTGRPNQAGSVEGQCNR